jgi:hypothetical protein
VAPSVLGNGMVMIDMYLCNLTQALTNCLRRPATSTTTKTSTPHKPTRRFLQNIRWRGARLLPYMDDLMLTLEP